MSKVEFSLVIPTRERADTLRLTLLACLQQDFDSYEIVVCDNCSSPATRQVIEEIGSPKIVYHRSPERLCMRDNWNLAYGLSCGKYVTYIGDDDSLMPYALSTLNLRFARDKVKAIRWESALYSWPNIARADLAHYLQIPLKRGVRRIDARQAIRDVLAGRVSATLLPNIYHGCVARDVLEEIRSVTGKVFDSFHCDTYSSFAVAYLAKEYLSLDAPLSISGFSASSNNIAFNFLRGKHDNTQTLRNENEASGLRLHPFVPDLPTGFVCVADSFLRAKEDLFPDDPITLDRRAMIERFIVAPPIDAAEEWREVEAELRRSVSDDPALHAWFDERVRNLTPVATPRENYRPPVEGVFASRLCLNASDYGVQDVRSATTLANRLLDYQRKGPEWIAGMSGSNSNYRKIFEKARIRWLWRAERVRIRIDRVRKGIGSALSGIPRNFEKLTTTKPSNPD